MSKNQISRSKDEKVTNEKPVSLSPQFQRGSSRVAKGQTKTERRKDGREETGKSKRLSWAFDFGLPTKCKSKLRRTYGHGFFDEDVIVIGYEATQR